MKVTFLYLEMQLASSVPGQAHNNVLYSSHTQIVSKTPSFIVSLQFFGILYLFFQDQTSPVLCPFFVLWRTSPTIENSLMQGPRLSCFCSRRIALRPKAGIMLAFTKVWEGHLLQALLFNIVLEVLASELGKNGVSYKTLCTD